MKLVLRYSWLRILTITCVCIFLVLVFRLLLRDGKALKHLPGTTTSLSNIPGDPHFNGTFKDGELVVLLEPSRGCHRDWTLAKNPLGLHPAITIFVVTSPADAGVRSLVRRTWASPDRLGENIQVIYAVGLAGASSTEKALETEARDFGDILQFRLHESYKSLAWKTFLILSWAGRNCPVSGLVAKVDSDVIILMDKLLSFIASTDNDGKPRIWGKCFAPRIEPALLRKGSKWFVDENFNDRKPLPMRCDGAAYLMTGDAPAKLVAAARAEAKYLHIEDIMFTGFAAERAGVLRANVEGFKSSAGDLGVIDCASDITQHSGRQIDRVTGLRENASSLLQNLNMRMKTCNEWNRWKIK